MTTTKITIGMDLGDRRHAACVLDAEGEIIAEEEIVNARECLEAFSQRFAGALIAMETGTHSPWISRLFEARGHRVIVANARKLRAISQSNSKSDVEDARMLARLCRADVKLLSPVKHRSEACQRALLVAIDALSVQIKALDEKLETLATETYPDTERLRQIPGVGPITALCFVLTLESPERFAHARDVGAYLGLVPRRDQSGNSDKQLGITKAGNTQLRCLLVNCAHYILGPFGPPTDLREAGLRIAAHGGPSAKKRAVIAVARKLAVTLMVLWKTRAEYQPTILKAA